MIENCALYLSESKLNLKGLLPDLTTDGGFFKKPSYYKYKIDDCVITLNIMPKNEINNHLEGFKNYISKLPNEKKDKDLAVKLVSQTNIVLGVTFSEPIGLESNTFASLIYLITNFNGFIFLFDSILLSDGNFLVGPLSMEEEKYTPKKIEINPNDFKHERTTEGIPNELVKMREKNYCYLAEYSFRCARWLPIEREQKLRPAIEIASRLYALNALVAWVVIPNEVAPTENILKMIEKNELRKWLTEEELEILDTPREEAQSLYMDKIGWRFENMWPLAWVLGFDIKPLFYMGQIQEDISSPMLLKFLPENINAKTLVEKNMIRSKEEIIELEDLFYCAHNAVRSAQMGSSSVPYGFHPISDGGAIHERRHSLTWCLSSDTSWEETDLST
ncbi:MAG: DUF4272 domain-containing protein [Candidatus Sericytochromatia bacterium]